MRILILNTYFSPFRGGEFISYNTFKMLREHGVKVYFMANTKQPYFESDYEYIKYFTKDITFIKEYLKNPLRYYYNIKAKKDVQKFIDIIKPDLIHVHQFITGFSPLVLDCFKGIPTIMTVHDCGIICPASTLMYKNREYCKNVKCKSGKFINCLLNKCDRDGIEGSMRKTIRSYIIPPKLKYIDRFITPSKALKEVLINANIGIKEENVFVINNFLLNDEIKTEPNYLNQGYFLYVGSLSKEKDVHCLLHAMKKLPKDIKLHIVGAGHEEKKLKHYAEENNLTNVEFLGFKNREEIKEEYQNCIAVIVPSNWFEIFGMVNIEAMINGKPVIGSNIGGIPEIVENDKTGLLFEPANVEQLKDCILKYRNNPVLAIEHGKNGYKKVLENYTEEIYYNKLISLYDEVLKRET